MKTRNKKDKDIVSMWEPLAAKVLEKYTDDLYKNLTATIDWGYRFYPTKRGDVELFKTQNGKFGVWKREDGQS